MVIAVTGATGQLGRLVVGQLKTKAPGAHIVALAREPGRAAGLACRVRSFNYSRPETPGVALAEIDTLLLVSKSASARA